MKILPYSATSYRLQDSSQTILGINDNQKLIDLLGSPNPRDIFFDWDTWAADPNNLNPCYLNNSANNLFPRLENLEHAASAMQQDSAHANSQIFRDQNLQIIPINVSVDSNEEIYCLLIITKKQQGRVIQELLKQHGLKGKQIAQLVKDGVITKEDGTKVYVEDVTGPSAPGPAVLILDLPRIENFRR